MNCKNFGDYHDLYLKTDVVLSADVFQEFRKTCLKNDKLDPLHYYIAPGLSFDALFKYTKEKLELLTDIDMYLKIEKGIWFQKDIQQQITIISMSTNQKKKITT